MCTIELNKVSYLVSGCVRDFIVNIVILRLFMSRYNSVAI